jgi:energy-converting hydrogenase Eha subunit E
MTMSQNHHNQRVPVNEILKAGLAEMGITSLTVLAYEASKAVLHFISPALYHKLAPMRSVLSRRCKKKK